MSEEKTCQINDVVKKYIDQRNGLVEDYENKINNLERNSPIRSLRTNYDVRPIDDEKNALHGHICDNVLLANSKKTYKTYKKYSSVVFDHNSYNFHIFPAYSKGRESLSIEFANIRDSICKTLQEPKKNYDLKFDFYKTTRKRAYQGEYGGEGSVGSISALSNLEDSPDGNGIYKYFPATKCQEANELNNDSEKGNVEISYSINFMRYTCNKGVVGCTMRAIQFHKDGGSINRGLNGFEICYTSDDQPNSHKQINSYITQKRTKYKIQHVCYNPPVDWPKEENGEYTQADINKIINRFIHFITVEGQKDQLNENSYNAWKTDHPELVLPEEAQS